MNSVHLPICNRLELKVLRQEYAKDFARATKNDHGDASRSTLLWPHHHLIRNITSVCAKPENRSERRNKYIYANVQTTTSKARLQENQW